MPKYRDQLPHLGDDLFFADGGMGTSLIFHHGLELPHFCSFPLLDDDGGRSILLEYFRPYLALSRELGIGFLLDSGPTWRASADWGDRLGYDADRLARINRDAIEMMVQLRDEFETELNPIVISGCMGPRGDGYSVGERMSIAEASDYHRTQVETFAASEADQVTAMTMTYAEEAAGIVLAAASANMPVVISFTVETDACLPTGQSLAEAIRFVDDATDGGPSSYWINCAHPTHFDRVLDPSSDWSRRIRGIRLNASSLSHAELDEATELDAGDPETLGHEVAAICAKHPQINLIGGCCGTDQRHIREMALRVRANA